MQSLLPFHSFESFKSVTPFSSYSYDFWQEVSKDYHLFLLHLMYLHSPVIPRSSVFTQSKLSMIEFSFRSVFSFPCFPPGVIGALESSIYLHFTKQKGKLLYYREIRTMHIKVLITIEVCWFS